MDGSKQDRSLETIARPLLHTVHTAAFCALLATGLLLFVPELRAFATGGYSLLIRRIHVWTAAASIAVPVAVLLYLGGPSVLAPVPGRSPRAVLKSAHQALTIGCTLAFAATGFVLWSNNPLYESIEDPSRQIHRWLTYGASALLAAHLVDVMLVSWVAGLRPAANRIRPPG